MRVPALLVALPLLAGTAAGIVLFDHIPDHLIVSSAAAAVLCVLAGTGFFLDDVAPGVVCAVCAGAALAGLSSGASAARALYFPSLLAWHDTHDPNGEPVVLEGRLREDDVGTLMEVDVHRACRAAGECAEVRGGVRLSIGSASAAYGARWSAGDRLRISTSLRRPASFDNPGLGAQARALARRGVALVGTVKSRALIDVVARGTWVEERAARLRDWIRRTLAARVGKFDPRSAGVASAILIGDRTGLSEEDERRLQDAGTYHVIAISGGNIAIFTALLLGVARLFRVPYRIAAA